jgi:ABC-type transport system involved in multi-copper enzyme maturation permease subunit
MIALKVILSKILCALLYVLGACVALYRLHFELFYLTPYLASANTLFCSIGRTQSNVAVLSISSYFPAALGIPAMCKLQTIQAELSNDK